MNQSIRRICLTATAACGLLLSSASAQTTATTDPVGAKQVTIPAGNYPFSPVFVHANSFVGDISGLSESSGKTTVVLSGASFSPDEFAQGSFVRYYLEITSVPGDSSLEGYGFDIATNSSSAVTVYGLLDSGFGIPSGSSVVIRKHMTISDVFENAEASLTAFGDSVKFFNDDGSSISLFYTGNAWSSDFSTDESDFPVYPGSGFLTVFSSEISFSPTGSVKTTKTKIPVYAGALNFVGSLAPQDTIAGDLGYQQSFLPFGDSAKLFTLDGNLGNITSLFAISDSTVSTDFSTSANDMPIEGETSRLVSVGSDKYLTIPPAFQDQ